MSENRISAEELRQTIDANYIGEANTIWHGLQITIKKHLSLDESLNFVERVVSACFAADTGEYIPEVKDFMIRCGILSDYANFDLPDDIDERFDLVYSTDLVRFVSEHIEGSHFEALLDAIDKKIDVQSSGRVEEMTKQVDEVIKGFNELEESLSKMFGGIDADTITQIGGAISNGMFDENKLASAVFALNNAKEDEE